MNGFIFYKIYLGAHMVLMTLDLISGTELMVSFLMAISKKQLHNG